MGTIAPADALAKRRAALYSVATSAGLTALKLAAGLVSGSLALLSEGAHNALDMLVSGLTYAAVRAADKPADEDHPFGHAKIEAVAALVQTAFLIALALGVAALAIGRLGGARQHSRRRARLLRRHRLDRDRHRALAGAAPGRATHRQRGDRRRRAALRRRSRQFRAGAGRADVRPRRRAPPPTRWRRSASRASFSSRDGGSASAPSTR